MISPTDAVYRLLPTSLSARELMDAYTPGLFERKFAEERTPQASPRLGLLVLLKTHRQFGYFVQVADVPNSILQHMEKQRVTRFNFRQCYLLRGPVGKSLERL